MTDQHQPGNVEVKLVGLTGSYRGNSYIFRGNEFLIGRMPESDLALIENTISANHAKIVKIGDQFEVQDLRSTNGTFVNGVKIDRKMLRSGDKLKFDRMEFEFVNPRDVSRTMMATPEAMAGLERTVVRAPQPPVPPAMPAPAPTPAPTPAPRQAAAAVPFSSEVKKGSLFGGSILGAIIALLLVYLVSVIVFLVQSLPARGLTAADVGTFLKNWSVTLPGMYTHAGLKATGLKTWPGIVIYVALILGPFLGGLIAQAVGKRPRAGTALGFSVLFVAVTLLIQLIVLEFKTAFWPMAFPVLLPSLGKWGNTILVIGYFWAVVFVLSFLGANFIRKRSD